MVVTCEPTCLSKPWRRLKPSAFVKTPADGRRRIIKKIFIFLVLQIALFGGLQASKGKLPAAAQQDLQSMTAEQIGAEFTEICVTFLNKTAIDDEAQRLIERALALAQALVEKLNLQEKDMEIIKTMLIQHQDRFKANQAELDIAGRNSKRFEAVRNAVDSILRANSTQHEYERFFGSSWIKESLWSALTCAPRAVAQTVGMGLTMFVCSLLATAAGGGLLANVGIPVVGLILITSLNAATVRYAGAGRQQAV